MAGPASLLQAQAAGLGGVLPGGYAGFMGFPGYVGVDTLLSGQAWAYRWHMLRKLLTFHVCDCLVREPLL